MKQNTLNNTGLDNKIGSTGGRILNKDGNNNIRKRGLPFYKRYSIYHTLINLSVGKFLASIFILYFLINLLFATFYFMLGPQGISIQNEPKCGLGFFQNCFFFSSQTLANVLSSIESLLGLLLFAVITGLSYARFAKPKSHIRFSNNLLMGPYQNGKALMFRLISDKNNVLTDLNMKVTAAIKVQKGDKLVNEFFQLRLEMDNVNALAFNWTIVHALDAESPFADYTFEDFEKNDVEIIVFLKAYDEHYSSQVLARTSYKASEFVDNAKFKVMFHQSPDNTHTILNLQKLNDFDQFV
jgi:inward rectifier potassium channel